MSDFEQERVVTMETLALLQGWMGTILEHLQTQRDNVVTVNQADATMVTFAIDKTLIVMDLIDPVDPPVVVSQPLSQAGPSRFVVAYPWGMPHTYNPQFAIGNPFMSYQSFVVAPANVNAATFLWGMPNTYSSQGVEIEETPVDIAED